MEILFAPNLKFIYLFLIMDGSTQFVVYSTPNFHESTPIGHYRNNIYCVMGNFYLWLLVHTLSVFLALFRSRETLKRGVDPLGGALAPRARRIVIRGVPGPRARWIVIRGVLHSRVAHALVWWAVDAVGLHQVVGFGWELGFFLIRSPRL
jgi:hypothetical protein